MIIIPAIDLRGGRCVRLEQGDFERETVYGGDPVEVARRFAQLEAPLIHVVDLDGARSGRPEQLEIVRAICRLGVPVELGGGLRSLDDVAAAMAAGVTRVVIGTAAIERPELIGQTIARFGPTAFVLGVDARGGKVAVRGWEATAPVAAVDLIERLQQAGVERVIYTDVERDGTLSSPNYDEVAAVAALGVAVIASGGVADRGQLQRLAAIPGVEAAIVGKALYAGTLVIGTSGDWLVDSSVGSRGTGGEDERT